MLGAYQLDVTKPPAERFHHRARSGCWPDMPMAERSLRLTENALHAGSRAFKRSISPGTRTLCGDMLAREVGPSAVISRASGSETQYVGARSSGSTQSLPTRPWLSGFVPV